SDGGPHQPRIPQRQTNMINFYYVYILRDVATSQHHYTGVTQDLHERLARHLSERRTSVLLYTTKALI
ncbi:MAG: GIY-YIG nuclease family protein, partial [Akkermansia sp.]|nr:GIY-YIG nuclease family protein [Akkermansia sp.]